MKPILFNTDMVRAILGGRKTVTRRVVKGPHYIDNADVCRKSGTTMHKGIDCTHGMPYPDGPYHPGDILWVRETWNSIRFGNGGKTPFHTEYWYKADDTSQNPDDRWRPSIHMPREAARLFLRVTGVRVERLQEITEESAMDEGVKDPYDYQAPAWYDQHDLTGNYAIDAFSGLWDSTIKPADLPLYGWKANPWVWCIEFERISKEAAQREEGQDSKPAPSAQEPTAL